MDAMSLKQDMKALIEFGIERGWKVLRTKGGHYKWMHENGAMFYSAGTPSDHRAIQNTRARIRRGEAGRKMA